MVWLHHQRPKLSPFNIFSSFLCPIYFSDEQCRQKAISMCIMFSIYPFVIFLKFFIILYYDEVVSDKASYHSHSSFSETHVTSSYPIVCRQLFRSNSHFPKLYAFSNLVFNALHWMQGGLVRRKLSVRLSNACIATKRKKDLSRFVHHTKEHLA